MAFLKTPKFYIVVHERDPHARILKENADYFTVYICLQIDEAMPLIIVQLQTFSGRNFPVVGLNTKKY